MISSRLAAIVCLAASCGAVVLAAGDAAGASVPPPAGADLEESGAVVRV